MLLLISFSKSYAILSSQISSKSVTYRYILNNIEKWRKHFENFYKTKKKKAHVRRHYVMLNIFAAKSYGKRIRFERFYAYFRKLKVPDRVQMAMMWEAYLMRKNCRDIYGARAILIELQERLKEPVLRQLTALRRHVLEEARRIGMKRPLRRLSTR